MTSATIKVLHISFDTDTSRYRVTLSNTLVSVRLLPFICMKRIYYERIKMSIGQQEKMLKEVDRRGYDALTEDGIHLTREGAKIVAGK